MKFIYLDQNVYSDFARHKFSTGNDHPFLAKLQALVEQKACAVPFSAAHVAETNATKDPKTYLYLKTIIERLSAGFSVTASGNVTQDETPTLINSFTSSQTEPISMPALPHASAEKARKILNAAGLNPGNLNALSPDKALDRIDSILKTLPADNSSWFEEYKAESLTGLERLRSSTVTFMDSQASDYEQTMKEQFALIEQEVATLPPEFQELLRQQQHELIEQGQKHLSLTIDSMKSDFLDTFSKTEKQVQEATPLPSVEPISAAMILKESEKVISQHFKNPNASLAFECYLLSVLGYFADKKERERQKSDPGFIEVWDMHHFMSALSCDTFVVQDGSLRERAKIVVVRHQHQLTVSDINSFDPSL